MGFARLVVDRQGEAEALAVPLLRAYGRQANAGASQRGAAHAGIEEDCKARVQRSGECPAGTR